jgi:hypothetical protein
MFELGRIEYEFERTHRTSYAARVARVATLLADARSDGDEQLALAALRLLADEVAERCGEQALQHVHADLAMVPLTV